MSNSESLSDTSPKIHFAIVRKMDTDEGLQSLFRMFWKYQYVLVFQQNNDRPNSATTQMHFLNE